MRHSISGWLVVIVLLSTMVGIVGGGVTGGLAGYYVAVNQAPSAIPSIAPELTVSQAPTQSAPVANNSVTEQSAVTDVTKKAEPAVVTIVNTEQVRTRRGFGSAVVEGSGVFIDAQGHIITNAHVVQNAQKLQVIYSDGTQVDATLVGADSSADIAVLQVSGKVPDFLSFGDSSALQLGESVIAIGSPLGDYHGSVTTGVVSGLNRSVQGSGETDLIQTDAAINSGNSGGPLLNLQGEIIGINTLVVRATDSGDVAEGLGFAIPSNTVTTVVNRIIAQSK